ncbi:MAG: DUF2946 family protein [Holosporales bacterium]|jgi:hypothetical protein
MRVLTWLLVASILFSSLIPMGYMPSSSETGRSFSIVICTGYDPQTITVDDNGQPVKKDSQKQTAHKSLCVFSVNAHAIAPVDPMAQVVLTGAYTLPLSAAPAAHPATAMLRKTAPPRAPPLFS